MIQVLECGFLYLMIAINSDKNVSEWFDDAVKELPITQRIGTFKKYFFQFHIETLKNNWGEGESYKTEAENIHQDYITTSNTLYQCIKD